MDHGFEEYGHGLRRYNYKYHHDESDGRGRLRISHTALPCCGFALRFSAVIDCTPGEERMPPLTIDIVSRNLPPAGAAPPAAEAPEVAGRFTCSSGDFVAPSLLQRAEEMVAAAGLPRECARSVNEFCLLSVACASNTFYASVAITVEAGVPGHILVDEDEDEVVPDGADTGECAICYKEYMVGGATSVKLPCSHVYHRKCLDKWTCVNATCPYCREPVPVPEEDYFWDDDEEDGGDGIAGDPELEHLLDEDDHTEEDGGTSGNEDFRSQPSSAWTHVRGTATFILGFLSNLARRPGRLFLN